MKQGRDPEPSRERFLTRWSRLKRSGATAAETAPATTPATSPPPAVGASEPAAGSDARNATLAAAQDEVVASLPPIESLSIDSDFAPFLQPKVPEALRRAAVKKLFADPHFNVMDGLDVYIDDYSKPDPIPPEMMERIAHARDLIDHPSNRIEREQAAAAAADESAESGAGSEEPAERASVDDAHSAAAPESQPAVVAESPSTSDDRALELREAAESVPQPLSTTNNDPAVTGPTVNDRHPN